MTVRRVRHGEHSMERCGCESVNVQVRHGEYGCESAGTRVRYGEYGMENANATAAAAANKGEPLCTA
jgi:hypothetical protein